MSDIRPDIPRSNTDDVVTLSKNNNHTASTSPTTSEEYNEDIIVHNNETPSSQSQQRTTRSQATTLSFLKLENLEEGNIQCPECQTIICLSEKGCNVVTCRNHSPQFLYFCAHCKEICQSEYSTCSCPKRNTRQTRSEVLRKKNERNKENPIELLDDDDDDNAEEQQEKDKHDDDNGGENYKIGRSVVRNNNTIVVVDTGGIMSKKSTKQKEKSRKLNALAIANLTDKLYTSKFWNLNPSSFMCCEEMPLDFVEFNESTRRYQFNSQHSGFTEDDLIAQSMVVYLLYRMEKGWGNQRSYQALPIWGGKPAKKEDNDDDPFPLENLWEDEIRELIASKKLGKTSLNHPDNFDAFTRLYDDREDRWSRRSTYFNSRLHILGEQATIQMALYLHKHVSEHYATLAAAVIHHALEGGVDDDTLMPLLAGCLIQTARREIDNFPKVAYDHIVFVGQNEGNDEPTSSRKRPRLD